VQTSPAVGQDPGIEVLTASNTAQPYPLGRRIRVEGFFVALFFPAACLAVLFLAVLFFAVFFRAAVPFLTPLGGAPP
jgi:hypothetical protein